MMIKTILVPTDGSEHAKKAVLLAADIAEKFDARMVILHVLSSDPLAYCVEDEIIEIAFNRMEKHFCR